MLELAEVKKIWPQFSPALFVAHNEEEYKILSSFLDCLIDEVGDDEKHPLASLMEVVGVIVDSYERQHVPELSSE